MEKENRKTQIVDLALQLIREKGYVAISYDDLSKQLGVTKASIHYHFEKKEDLGVAVTERIGQNLESFLSSITKSAMTVEEKLKQYTVRQIAFCGEGICPISSLQSDFLSLPDLMKQKVKELSQFELKILITILTEGHNKDVDQAAEEVEALAYTVLSCIKGALQYKRTLGKDVLPQILNQLNRLVQL
ncbi:TetR/AcrR family transcriptional regulator [Paenibacillus montanisoli]|uniref:TetR/AcrR family transcriptional regulator n=1 Tax=Paenibacillus montanisoli TaxID=2081970 RepID=A0A328U7R8_9BACL|nr:TetR/AcrR family transcriptional regulator [Paenibacillus montanisoli]RAP78727.1 TetR/AcrR family transcriptional regulator [Paenibacillus montanisoli]